MIITDENFRDCFKGYKIELYDPIKDKTISKVKSMNFENGELLQYYVIDGKMQCTPLDKKLLLTCEINKDLVLRDKQTKVVLLKVQSKKLINS